jgi:hypothetical protein
MRTIFLLLILAIGVSRQAWAQSAAAPAAPSVPEPAAQAAGGPTADPELHQAVLKLLAAMGTREQMKEGIAQSIPESKAKFKEAAPGVTPEFLDEWARRMQADSSVDAYFAAITAVYEKHFTLSEVRELTQMQQDVNDGKKPVASEALKAKLSKDGTDISAEVVSECGDVGAKLGGRIAGEIEKEHPEWVKDAPPKSSGPKN